MAKRKHYGNRNHNGGAGAQAPPPAARPAAPPKYQKALAQLAAALRITAPHASDGGAFVPKPRALRRYERYANMGNDN